MARKREEEPEPSESHEGDKILRLPEDVAAIRA